LERNGSGTQYHYQGPGELEQRGNQMSDDHTQSGKAAISAPAEKYINLYLDDVSTLRALATELLQQYNALIDLPAADLLAWQKEARRRRSLPENVRVQ
jgi:hypothetical protein